METIIFITALFIFLICILLIIFLKTKSDFNNIFNNVFVSQEEINSYLSKKQDCIFRILNILENKLKIDQSIYKSIKVSLSKKLSSIDKDKTLEKEYNNILKISEDFPKLKNFKTYKEIINDIETINTHLVALRTFYNKYTTIYNKMIKTPIYFPFVKHKKLTLKKYYEEKVLNDTINF